MKPTSEERNIEGTNASGYKEKSTMSKKNQYKERGIYKVRQDGTKVDFVPFRTRAEKLAEKLAGEKKRALILQKLQAFIADIDTGTIAFNMEATNWDTVKCSFCAKWFFEMYDGKEFWEVSDESGCAEFIPKKFADAS